MWGGGKVIGREEKGLFPPLSCREGFKEDRRDPVEAGEPPPPAPAMGCLVLTQPLFSVLGSAGDRPGCPPPPPSPHFIPGISGWFVGLPLLCLWPRSHAEFFCTSEEEQSPGRSRLGGELRGPLLREPGCQGGASRTGLSKEAGSVAASLASSSGISCGCEQVAV